MKRIFIFLAVLIPAISLQLSAQTSDQDVKDALTNTSLKVTWLGADFSHCKIKGTFDCTPEQFVSQFIPAINNVILAEPTKYDFAKFLNKASFTTDIQSVTKANSAIDPGMMTQDEKTKLDEATINKIVSGYDLKGKEGIGAVLIYESISKQDLYATMYFAYVKMPEGKVILSKPVGAKPAGFGLRNFWASTVYSFLKDYNKAYLKAWKTDYGIK